MILAVEFKFRNWEKKKSILGGEKMKQSRVGRFAYTLLQSTNAAVTR